MKHTKALLLIESELEKLKLNLGQWVLDIRECRELEEKDVYDKDYWKRVYSNLDKIYTNTKQVIDELEESKQALIKLNK